MNLDNYIAILNRQLEKNQEAETLSDAFIVHAIHSKATNLAAKVSRALQWEGGMLIIVLAMVCIALIFGTHPFLQLIAAFSLTICIAMALLYVWKYRQLNHLTTYENDTVNLLRGLITAVKQLINIYTYAITISMVAGGFLGAIYGILESEASASQMPSVLTAWYAVPLSIVFIVLLLWATKWYLFRLYGQPLYDLEKCLAVLEALNKEQ